MPGTVKPYKEDMTTHERWIQAQGIPIYREFSIPSLNELEVGPWERLEALGAYVVLEGQRTLMMLIYHNLDFFFHNDFIFNDRFSPNNDFFTGKGNDRPERSWETNFVEDIRTFPLIRREERGAGGFNRRFQLAEGTMIAHVSQFPVGTYKKGHRHGSGAHVVVIQGKGYSLLWQDNEEDRRARVDWREGSVLVPPDMWWHQHFNTSKEPAKYLAISWGSMKYPLFKAWVLSGKTAISAKEGGNQIEYEDEAPSIRQLFEEELRKNGVSCNMPPIK